MRRECVAGSVLKSRPGRRLVPPNAIAQTMLQKSLRICTYQLYGNLTNRKRRRSSVHQEVGPERRDNQLKPINLQVVKRAWRRCPVR